MEKWIKESIVSKVFHREQEKCTHLHCMCVLYTKTHTKEKGDLYFSHCSFKAGSSKLPITVPFNFHTITLLKKKYLAAGENYQTKGMMIEKRKETLVF